VKWTEFQRVRRKISLSDVANGMEMWVFSVAVLVVVLKKVNLACGMVLPLSMPQIIGPSCAEEVWACMLDAALPLMIIGQHSSVHISPLLAEFSSMQFYASYAKTYL
jgi:hypothetical protein